jgi:hypothetical protein
MGPDLIVLLFAVGFLVWVGSGFLLALGHGKEERHQECLESIARMEPELFPDLPKELAWVEVKMSPYDEIVRTAWLVSESEQIMYLGPGRPSAKVQSATLEDAQRHDIEVQ